MGPLPAPGEPIRPGTPLAANAAHQARPGRRLHSDRPADAGRGVRSCAEPEQPAAFGTAARKRLSCGDAEPRPKGVRICPPAMGGLAPSAAGAADPRHRSGPDPPRGPGERTRAAHLLRARPVHRARARPCAAGLRRGRTRAVRGRSGTRCGAAGVAAAIRTRWNQLERRAHHRRTPARGPEGRGAERCELAQPPRRGPADRVTARLGRQSAPVSTARPCPAGRRPADGARRTPPDHARAGYGRRSCG